MIFMITHRLGYPHVGSTHTYIHTYIHTHIHTYTHTHAYTHTYIHTYTCIHTYTHTHIHTCIAWDLSPAIMSSKSSLSLPLSSPPPRCRRSRSVKNSQPFSSPAPPSSSLSVRSLLSSFQSRLGFCSAPIASELTPMGPWEALLDLCLALLCACVCICEHTIGIECRHTQKNVYIDNTVALYTPVQSLAPQVLSESSRIFLFCRSRWGGGSWRRLTPHGSVKLHLHPLVVALLARVASRWAYFPREGVYWYTLKRPLESVRRVMRVQKHTGNIHTHVDANDHTLTHLIYANTHTYTHTHSHVPPSRAASG
jgi:hypothetical protein